MTINLTTGEHYPPRREDYITKCAAVKPSPDCPTPLWTAFLDRVTAGDKDLQAYLKRMAGYCLTGYTHEHALFFLYGKGANGKGVFLNTLTAIWGTYAAVAAMETFVRAERSPSTSRLQHKRSCPSRSVKADRVKWPIAVMTSPFSCCASNSPMVPNPTMRSHSVPGSSPDRATLTATDAVTIVLPLPVARSTGSVP